MLPTTVRAAALMGLADLVVTQGVQWATLLDQVGLTTGHLEDPETRIPFRCMVQLLDLAAQATDDDLLGLHLGAAQSWHIAGVLGYALRASPDVATQVACTQRYVALHQDGASVELRLEGPEAALLYTVLDPHVTLHRHDAEATAALCVGQWRALTGQPQWAPSSVHFEHPAPHAASERGLRQFFGCPVHFSAPHDAVRFPREFLKTPIRTADPGLHQILSRHADDCLTRHSGHHTLATRVQRLIAAGLGSGPVSVDSIAVQLATTPRTLQRRLVEEGQAFADLLENTRRELATQYLRDARVSLTDVAFLVGYSDLSAFHRAFRRWFQQTPLDYQRAHRPPRATA